LRLGNAVRRRVCEGDTELRTLANEALRIIGMPRMEALAHDMSVESFFAGLEAKEKVGFKVDLEEHMQLDADCSELLQEIKREYKPRGHISLGIIVVWSHWEKIGLPRVLRARPDTPVQAVRLHRPSVEALMECVMMNQPVVVSGGLNAEEFPPMRDFADFDYLRLRCGSRSVKVKGDHCFARDGRRVFVLTLKWRYHLKSTSA